MPKSLKTDSTVLLVARSFSLRSQISVLEAELACVEKELIARGKGKHIGGEGQEITVVIPEPGKPSYKLSPENEEAARAIVGDLDIFKSLFDRKVVYTPCEGFITVAPKLLKKRACTRLLNLCAQAGRKPQEPYVKYPKEAKVAQ